MFSIPVEFASCYGLSFLHRVDPMVKLVRCFHRGSIIFNPRYIIKEKANKIPKMPMAESLTCGTFVGFLVIFPSSFVVVYVAI